MVKQLEYDTFAKYLYLDSTSPSGLRWAVYRNGNALKDSIAGHKGPRGYWVVRLNNVTYYVHRILWLLTYKEDPAELVINHIDNDPSNNEISNLEVCTTKENAQRTKRQTTEYTTITEHLDSHGNYNACASWYENGKQVRKTFSYNKYGIMEAQYLAKCLRKEKSQELYKK